MCWKFSETGSPACHVRSQGRNKASFLTRARISASPLKFRMGLRFDLRAGNELIRLPPFKLGRETRGARTPEVGPQTESSPPPGRRPSTSPAAAPGSLQPPAPEGRGAPTLTTQPLGSSGRKAGEGRVPARGLRLRRVPYCVPYCVPILAPRAAETQVRPGVRSPLRACGGSAQPLGPP